MNEGTPIGQGLRILQQAHARVIDFERAYALTSAQFSVLAAVVNMPGSDQTAVREATFLDKSTLTAVTSRLVERRLVLTKRNGDDLRRAEMTPTRTAIALVYDATPQLVKRDEGFLRPLDRSMRDSFLWSLRDVAFFGSRGVPPVYRVPSPDGERPPLEVPWGLGRLFRAATQRNAREWLARIDSVTFVQWLVLDALVGHVDLDQRSLGDLIRLDKATASVLIGRLSSRGLVMKERSSVDRRVHRLNVSSQGEALLAAVTPLVAEVERALSAPISDAAFSQLSFAMKVLLGAHRMDS